MKNILPLFISILLCACNNNKSTTEKTTTDTTGKSVEKTGKITESPEEKTNLEALTPLTEGELKAKLPGQAGGISRSDLETSSAMGTLSAIANYIKNDSISVKIEVVDCGGPGGSGLFNTQYAGVTPESGTDEETTFKITQFKGQKSFESCMKNRPADCTFTFFDGTRYLVYIEGKNTGIEMLRNIAGELSFK